MKTAAKPERRSAPERASRARQRQRLIEACISALHEYGPSRTTIDKVVGIADMSPGIVNFYFETKAALLIASLEFLAQEFEDHVLSPVTAARADPFHALQLLIDLYLDPAIASPRKVSVWYAFWGEANARAEYYAICGKRDLAFADLVRDLILACIAIRGDRHLDADAVALGLIGCLEVLWQEIAFRDERSIDRALQRLRCRAYLDSVFPRHRIASVTRGPPNRLGGLDLLLAGHLVRAGIAAASVTLPDGAVSVLAHPPNRRPQSIAICDTTALAGSAAFAALDLSACDWIAFVRQNGVGSDPGIYLVPSSEMRRRAGEDMPEAEFSRLLQPWHGNFRLDARPKGG